MSNWDDVRHFRTHEFDSEDMPGSGKYMDIGLIKKLDAIREDFGKRMVVTSGFRTAEHNDDVGGKPNSAHLRGKAADIRCWGMRNRDRLIELSYKHGIRRRGVAKSFIHLDVDETLSRGTFLY